VEPISKRLGLDKITLAKLMRMKNRKIDPPKKFSSKNTYVLPKIK
jgi:hypothetical protein